MKTYRIKGGNYYEISGSTILQNGDHYRYRKSRYGAWQVVAGRPVARPESDTAGTYKTYLIVREIDPLIFAMQKAKAKASKTKTKKGQ